MPVNPVKRRWTTERWEQHLGEQIRRARLAENWSQSELARRANVGRSAVSSIELGEGSTLSTFVRIVRALGRHDWLDELAPDPGLSPIALLEAQRRGAPRRRASSPRADPARADSPGGEDPAAGHPESTGGR